MNLSARLAALRIARREVRRTKGRAALVIALVGLPVAALSFGAVVYDTFQPTPAERADRLMGRADAVVRMDHDGPVTQQHPGHLYGEPRKGTGERAPDKADLLDVLPAGTRLYPHRTGSARVKHRYGSVRVETRGLDYDNPIAAGILHPVTGRAPRRPDEVALSPAAAQRLGARVGGTIRLVRPEPGRYRVVGLVELPDSLRARVVVFRPDAMPGEKPADTSWLADTREPLTWQQVRRLNRHGMVAVSRQVLLDPPAAVPSGGPGPGEELAAGVLVAGMALLEIVLLAGPAFAISARRRQRELALVAAAGGTPAHVRWIVLADGVVLGGLGALAGIVTGAIAAVAGIPLLETHVMLRRGGAIRLFPLALAGIGGLAVLTGVLAALLPAIAAARQDVVTALGGRRGVVRSRRRWVAVGLALTATGMVAAFLGAGQLNAIALLAGLVLVQLGLAICMPALIGAVTRIGAALPLAARIAIRTTGRHRGAAAPALAAVMAAVAAAVTVGTFIYSDDRRTVAQYQAGLPTGYAVVPLDPTQPDGAGQAAAAARVLRHTLPDADVRQVRTVRCGAEDTCEIRAVPPPRLRCPLETTDDVSEAEFRRYRNDPRCRPPQRWSGYSWWAPVVADAATLTAMTGADPDHVRAAAEVLAAGGVVVGDPKYLHNGRVTLSWRVPSERNGSPRPRPGKTRQVRVPGYVLRRGTVTPDLIALGTPLVRRLELTPAPLAVVAATRHAPTEKQQHAANRELTETGLRSNGRDDGPLYVERGPRSEIQPYLLLLGALTGLVMLAASAIATGLVLSDSRAELATLAAVGASPGLRRRLTLAQSGLVSGLGGVVGSLVGVGTATAILLALNRQLAGETPWAVRYPYVVPWSVLAITMVVVPMVAMLGAGLLTRSRLPIERRLS